MTDTTDKITLQQLKDVRELCLPHTAWRSIIDELISKRDQLEAERQRAASGDAMLTECIDSLKAAEAEIVRMKGEQVPVAITDDMAIAFHAATTDSALGRGDMEEIKAGLRAVQELFTAPQKPIVLHDERDHYQDTDEYEQGYARGWNASRMEAKAAIEATGGTVKGW